MKIANKKVEVPEGCEYNDKDYMNRTLNCLKNLSKNYVVALTEASNEVLYKKYLDQFLSILQMQRDIYELMFKYGWYELTTAEQKDICKTYDNLAKEYDSLCN